MDNNKESIAQETGSVYYSTAKIEKKEAKPLEKKDIIFALLFVVCSFLIVCLGMWGGFRLGFTVSYFALFGVTSAYLFKKADAFSIICGVLSLAGALSFTLYRDSFINTIMMLLVMGLFTVYSLGISDTFTVSKGSFKMLFDIFKGATINVFSSFSDVFSSVVSTANKKKKSLGGFIGALVAIPFLIVIIPLLTKSDAAFEGLINAIGKNFSVVLLQLGITALIAPYIYTYMYEKRMKQKSKKLSASSKKKASASACTSFLAVISVVYVVYLFSQLAYFFSAFKGILPEDYEYTASAFARRGFFEMFAICIINVLVVSGATMLARKKSVALKIFSCFISLFSVLMIAIAMQKMKLNVSIYGLSKNRVMVSVFMIMLLVMIAFFILHIFLPKINYMQSVIVICSAIFIALTFSNVDARIAQYNINAFESGKLSSLDIEMISNLSDSAVPELVGLMNSKDKNVARQATYKVAELCMSYKNKEDSDLRGFNLAEMRAEHYATDTVSPLLDNVLGIIDSDDCYYYEYDSHEDYYTVNSTASDKTYIYKFDNNQGIYVKVK